MEMLPWILRLLMIQFTVGFNPRFYGEWSLWHSRSKNILLSNRVIISLYPENKYILSEKKNIGLFLVEYTYSGCFKIEYDIIKNMMNKNKGKVICRQKQIKIQLLSVGGVGLDELPIFFMQNVNKKIRLNFDIIGKDDIFLSKYDNYFHLIRHTRVNEPTINVPFSTLLFTNFIGFIINYFIHKFVN